MGKDRRYYITRLLSCTFLEYSSLALISDAILSNSGCKKLLQDDGIASRNLILSNIFEKVILRCKNVNKLKETNKELGLTLTLIKNLDEYQYIMCNYIPQLGDTNIYKLKFQKIRILISLLFEEISKILKSQTEDIFQVQIWNRIANYALYESSEAVLQFREQKQSNENDLKYNPSYASRINLKRDYFEHFNCKEEQVNNILFNVYNI